MRPLTRAAAKESLDTRVWFMLVDEKFTRAWSPWYVDVPSDGVVLHFLEKIKELGWDEFKNVHAAEIMVWKLPTPQPAREVMKKTYLASVKPEEEILEEEEEMGGEGMGKAEEKAKQESKAASQLFPSDKISLCITEPASPRRICVLVQVAAKAKGTSCCAVSTRYQLIQLRRSSKHNLRPHVGPNLIAPRRHDHSASNFDALPAVAPLAPQDEYPSKRRRLADCPDYSWLEEVRLKMWNNSALEPKLF